MRMSAYCCKQECSPESCLDSVAAKIGVGHLLYFSLIPVETAYEGAQDASTRTYGIETNAPETSVCGTSLRRVKNQPFCSHRSILYILDSCS